MCSKTKQKSYIISRSRDKLLQRCEVVLSSYFDNFFPNFVSLLFYGK